jgi:hypothetical protein
MIGLSLLLACAVAPLPTERATRFEGEALRARPRPSDPWSAARDAPGVIVDRVDVGGSETAQQSLLVAGGDNGGGAGWSLDGIDITDPGAPGFAAVFVDTALAAALEVRTHARDARVRTPGAQVAIALPEAGPRWSGGARAISSFAQSGNLPEALAERPFLRNETEGTGELAADGGGPIVRDRLSLWAGVSRRRADHALSTGHGDRLEATLLAAKARLRAGGASFTLLALRAEKTDEDRDPTLSAEPAARWTQSGPAHLLALEARRPFGGVSLVLRASALRSGFDLVPRGGIAPSTLEDFRGVTRRSYLAVSTDRPRDAVDLEGSGQGEAFGFRHRLEAGVGLARSRVETASTWPGNQVLGIERRDVFFRAFELTGFALPTRGQALRTLQDRAFAFAQDEARRGRLTLAAGLRVERQSGRALESSVAANPEFPDLLPEVAFGGAPSRFDWLDALPRAAAAWQVDDRTVVAVDYAEYAGPLSPGDVGFDSPLRDVASLTYYWLDANGDGAVQAGELDLVRGRVGANNVDPAQPASLESPHAVDPGLRAPRTRSLGVGVRLAASRWSASGHLSWRRSSHALWRPLRGLDLGDYAIRGAVTGEVHGEPYSVGYYAPAGAVPPGNGRLLTNREGYRQDAIAAAIEGGGRWGRVRADGFVSFTDWREFFTDRERAVQDPTSLESEPLIDGGAVAARPGGLGRGDVVVNARLAAGATVRVELPFAAEAVAVVHAREGFPIPYYQVASTGDPTGGSKAVLVASRLDAFRLPALVLLDVRLAKAFGVGKASVTAFLDAMNAANTSATLQVARDVELPAFDRPREIVRPRLLRAGLDVRF